MGLGQHRDDGERRRWEEQDFSGPAPAPGIVPHESRLLDREAKPAHATSLPPALIHKSPWKSDTAPARLLQQPFLHHTKHCALVLCKSHPSPWCQQNIQSCPFCSPSKKEVVCVMEGLSQGVAVVKYKGGPQAQDMVHPQIPMQLSTSCDHGLPESEISHLWEASQPSRVGSGWVPLGWG